MKKVNQTIVNLIVMALIVTYCGQAYSQDKPAVSATSTPATDKFYASAGIIEISGAASYSSISESTNGQSNSSSVSILNFAPQFGVFITNGMELGFNTGVSYLP